MWWKRILYIIMIFIPIVNIWPAWRGTDLLPGIFGGFILRVVITIVSVIFYFPAVVFGILAIVKG